MKTLRMMPGSLVIGIVCGLTALAFTIPALRTERVKLYSDTLSPTTSFSASHSSLIGSFTLSDADFGTRGGLARHPVDVSTSTARMTDPVQAAPIRQYAFNLHSASASLPNAVGMAVAAIDQPDGSSGGYAIDVPMAGTPQSEERSGNDVILLAGDVGSSPPPDAPPGPPDPPSPPGPPDPPSPVPEPSALLLLGLGLFGVVRAAGKVRS